MIKSAFLQHLSRETDQLQANGTYKQEHILISHQKAVIRLQDGQEVINLCANNYLGLSSHPELIAAAKTALDQQGYGMSSVRFICGTQDIHKQLEKDLSEFLGMEDTLLYSSCFDANTGLFETLLQEGDVIISDELNHASIIDGIRLCKANRLRYRNNDMQDLAHKLDEAKDCRVKLIVTDGVFSMDGTLANLPAICNLAEQHNAFVMVDDSHALGVMGKQGRGTPEYHGVIGRVDIVTGTLGKALGGASGGFTSASHEIVTWLRQRSRPYLFSNSLAPMIVASSIKALEMLQTSDVLRLKLHENTRYFRDALMKSGFTIIPSEHPIIPIILGEATLAHAMAAELLKQNIYVVGFTYPVVQQDKARIRVQISAAHEAKHLDRAMAAFTKVGKSLKII